MKIFTAEQIREADKYTLAQESIKSIDLMERAANELAENIPADSNLFIFCGLGNNGGDGLALARLILEDVFEIHVVIVNYSDKRSDDFKNNLVRLKNLFDSEIIITEINSPAELQTLTLNKPDTILIDALLGTGVNRPTEGLLAETIKFINVQNAKVISIDIPSGLYADGGNGKDDVIVHAGKTLTFQFPKLTFMFSENRKYIGEYKIIDIGLSPEYINKTATPFHFIMREDVQPILKTRNRIAHKGNFGHALIIAGSNGKMGAAVLATRACMHTGAGLVTVHIPKCGYTVIQVSIPEAMAETDSETDFITDNINIEKYNAVGIGPGIGTEKQTANVLKLVIQNSSRPIVFDADALNILSENKTWLSFIPAQSIFTPHLKEWERLVGKVSNSVERIKQQQEFSLKHNLYVVLKGANTSVSAPSGEVYFNSTGNPGMAKGGSGDLLTGVITSLLAQGYNPLQSCIMSVFLHGAAADFTALNKTEETMTASDIINHFSDAFKYVRS